MDEPKKMDEPRRMAMKGLMFREHTGRLPAFMRDIKALSAQQHFETQAETNEVAKRVLKLTQQASRYTQLYNQTPEENQELRNRIVEAMRQNVTTMNKEKKILRDLAGEKLIGEANTRKSLGLSPAPKEEVIED